jgi:hypothetical protein
MISATRLIAFLFLIIAISILIKKTNIQEGMWIWNIPTRETISIHDLRGNPKKPTSTIIKHVYMPNQPYYNSIYTPQYTPYYYNPHYHNPYYYNNYYRNPYYHSSLDIDLNNHFRTYYPADYYKNNPRYLEYV